jgi:hypothetical protein
MSEHVANDIDAPRRDYRLKLRTLFAFMVCFAVGLSVGAAPRASPGTANFYELFIESDWYIVLLGSTAAAIVAGLGQESAVLASGLRANPLREALKSTIAIEVAWRLLLSALLVVCLATQFALRRNFIQLPYGDGFVSNDVLTTFVFPLAILTAISAASNAKAAVPRRGRMWLNALAVLGAAFIVVYVMLTQRTLIVYLVHIATAGVDAAQRHTATRYHVDTLAELTSFANLATEALVAYALAAALLADALRRRGRSMLRKLEAGCGALLLAASAAYCVWYNAVGLPMASPDLADAYRDTYLRISGPVLGLMIASVGAYRNAKNEEPPIVLARPRLLHESAFCLACLLGATVVLVVDFVRSYWNFSSVFGGTSNMEFAGGLVGDPETQLRVALALVSLAAGWRAWKLRGLPKSTMLSHLDLRRLVITWTTLAALLAVGVNTLAAFGFAFWMRPWFLK